MLTIPGDKWSKIVFNAITPSNAVSSIMDSGKKNEYSPITNFLKGLKIDF